MRLRTGGMVLALLAGALLASAPAFAAERIVMAGSSAGGASYLYFATVAKLFNDGISGYDFSARTGGTTENVPLVETGEVKIAAASPGGVVKLYGADGLKSTRLRTLYAMFHAPFHILVPKDSPIKSFTDLKGKRLSVGVKGGGDWIAFLKMAEANGLKESDYDMRYLGKSEGINALKDGSVDALVGLAPVPSPLITEMGAHPKGVRVVAFTPKEVQNLVAKSPEFAPFTIAKGTYTPAPDEVVTFTEWYYVVARDDLSEKLAFDVTKILDQQHDKVVAALKLAASSTAENTAKYPGFKLHAGTQKYLREKGLLK